MTKDQRRILAAMEPGVAYSRSALAASAGLREWLAFSVIRALETRGLLRWQAGTWTLTPNGERAKVQGGGT